MDTALESDAAWVAQQLREADVAVALTGAGMSTASGVPDFRGDDGIWNSEFDPASFHRDRFVNDPAGFWQERVRLHERMFPDDVAPNTGHDALAKLESRGILHTVITQNTDGLHREAGSYEVVELHGNASQVVCEDCESHFAADAALEQARAGDVPATCDKCGGVVKPDVVLFGEQLPQVAYSKANRLADKADVFLALGSSLTVHPAAGLAGRAAEDGSLVVVNFDETQYDSEADRVIRDDLTEFLPAVEALV
ncbi:Sir2 family transcriptional regulator / NAD-dependent deacetylase [Haloferax mucosum ATCC BAA-1512]|uniref:Sir2 family transcriptional regulator / NAD-dependent deacetylase n=1 Tax=Haloferax mucosum ATCC BAA-1512 TaxID=662479 RepID=M0IJM5_9EURY|nr:NAD-dependent protein deacylase [Haloferax mucosum]ELZ96955.1 Sir2 family transcriptional regulator / NAD-dependent deacetylase [Haloferax mucosum ATCC BAA-1512]